MNEKVIESIQRANAVVLSDLVEKYWESQSDIRLLEVLSWSGDTCLDYSGNSILNKFKKVTQIDDSNYKL